MYKKVNLLGLFCVAVAEFLDTASSIYKHALTGVEWMAHVGDFHLYQWVFVAVFPLNSFASVRCRAGEKSVVIAHVFEHDHTEILRMDVFFHFSY